MKLLWGHTLPWPLVRRAASRHRGTQVRTLSDIELNEMTPAQFRERSDGRPAGATASETGMTDEQRRDWALPANEVHVWRACLDRTPAVVRRMAELLVADERDRARRPRAERDRARYIVGRGLLRALLGRYVRLAPQQLEFQYGAQSKPALARAGPSFNLSHSGSVALYAFSAAGEVGIDVELLERAGDGQGVAERFFSGSELGVLRSLAPELRQRAFLACWTRKEAFIKARGDGLRLALDSFDVTLAPDAPAALLRTTWSEQEPSEWQLADLSDPDAGYIAAVAIHSHGLPVVVKRYSVDKLEATEGAVPGSTDRVPCR